jgi:hypothetical protein
MSEPFDPYLHWLGIRDPQRPPDYYRLLGIELFEGDPDVIANAADRQMSHVRTFQTGRHSAESQQVLNELARAKLCLLDPPKKAQYDAWLLSEQQPATQPAGQPPGTVVPSQTPLQSPPAAAGAVPVSPAVPAAVPPVGGSPRGRTPIESSPSLTFPRTRRIPRTSAIVAVLIAMILALSAGILLVLTKGGTERERQQAAGVGQETPAPTEDGSGTETETLPGAGPGPSGRQTAASTPGESTRPQPGAPASPGAQLKPEAGSRVRPQAKPSPELQPVAQAPLETPTTVDEAISLARKAMAARNPEAARRYLDVADELALPRDHDRIESLREALGPLAGFLTALRRGIEELKPGETLDVAGRQVAVAEVAADSVILQDGDQQTRYTAATLPWELALAVAGRKLPDVSASLVSKAAFLIFDPQGDRDLARQWCGEAESAGLLVGALIAELDRATTPPEQAPASQAASKRPVPDEAALSVARQEVREVFKDRYAQAQRPDEKESLARTLLSEAVDTVDNPAARYVLLDEARDLAVQAGRASLLSEVVGEMAKHYDVDPRRELTRTLVDAVERPLPSTARRDLGVEAARQADEALRADDFQTAAVLARAANSLALKGRDVVTAKKANEMLAEIPRLEKQYQASLEAAKLLAAEPDNPQANLALGKYDCFFRKEPRWERGLPGLAKGDDPVLKALAEAELGASASLPAAQEVRLADQWHEAAVSLPDEIRSQARARAAFWYKKALDELSGFTKARVEKALEEIAAEQPDRGRP